MLKKKKQHGLLVVVLEAVEGLQSFITVAAAKRTRRWLLVASIEAGGALRRRLRKYLYSMIQKSQVT
jgi:hypothetical protein